jgi:hypothetical protein
MSSEKMILSGVSFDCASDVKYSKPKVNAVGGKSVGILNAATNSATYISTPLMLTWGVNSYTDDKTGKTTYDMSLQFPLSDYANADTTAFLENMKAFEERVKADAIANSKEWFGKTKMSADVIDALWTPMLKYPKDKDTGESDMTRSPTLRIKMPVWEGEWKCELYDMDRTQIFPDSDVPSRTPLDIISKGANIATVIQCGGIWFANGKFGITWKLFQGVVKPKASLRGTCHIQLSNDDKQKLAAQKDDEDSEEEGVELADDSDAEEEAKEEVATVFKAAAAAEPVEEEPKKTVKKRVVKKKA